MKRRAARNAVPCCASGRGPSTRPRVLGRSRVVHRHKKIVMVNATYLCRAARGFLAPRTGILRKKAPNPDHPLDRACVEFAGWLLGAHAQADRAEFRSGVEVGSAANVPPTGEAGPIDGFDLPAGLDPPAGFEKWLVLGAAAHGIRPLLWQIFRRRYVSLPISAQLMRALEREVMTLAARDALERVELVRVLEALAVRGVRPVLMKGVSLAYSVYPVSVLRPRADCDLFISPADRAKVNETLVQLGYAALPNAARELSSYQMSYVRRTGTLALDVHWQVNNRQRAAQLMPWAQFALRALPIPALGPNAWGLSLPDQFIVCAFHRLAHDRAPDLYRGNAIAGSKRLIWLYDLYLLVQVMSVSERHALVRLATDMNMARICWAALEEVQRRFGMAPPLDLQAGLSHRHEGLSEDYPRRGGPRAVVDELWALPSLAKRVRLIAEWLFPPAAYIHATARWGYGGWH